MVCMLRGKTLEKLSKERSPVVKQKKNNNELPCEWQYISTNEVRTAVFTRVLRNKATSSAGDAKGLVCYAMHPDIRTCDDSGQWKALGEKFFVY